MVTSSVLLASRSMPGMSVYSASKAALTSIAESYAVELAPKGIRVNTISPGPIQTPIIGRMGLSQEQLEGFSQNVKSKVPLGRFGTADEGGEIWRCTSRVTPPRSSPVRTSQWTAVCWRRKWGRLTVDG